MMWGHFFLSNLAGHLATHPKSGGFMSTDFSVVFERKARATFDSEADVAVASIWLAIYLLMLLGNLSAPLLAQSAQLATLY